MTNRVCLKIDPNEKCPCKRRKCKRHSNCEECREYHKTSGNKYAPACERKSGGKNEKDIGE
ncbi:MAG: hypothetical protein HFE49_09600 [Clostridia bacterium]|nr:hypothetical protein [Clostridia bacterium]